MKTIFSKEPEQLGVIDVKPPEMMFVQDMLIALPNQPLRIPKNLDWIVPMLIYSGIMSGRLGEEQYIYLTAKHLFTGPNCSWNRPGWHIDGYGTDDINFLWCDSYPTEFCVNQEFELSDDHNLSMVQMTEQALTENIKTYPVGTLLKLDNTIVHRVQQPKTEGFRTFVKISVSKNKYNRVGNAHNYLIDYNWDMIERDVCRNDPAHKEKE